MLAVSEQLLELYHLEILSPLDLLQSPIVSSYTTASLEARFGVENVSVSVATEADKDETEKFLTRCGVSQSDLATIWSPGTNSTPRRRFVARLGTKLMAVASWDGPSSFSRPVILHLYVDEASSGVEAVIDHVLESVQQDAQPLSVRVVTLDAPIDQTKTRMTARKRGFLKPFSGERYANVGKLSKLTFSGLISSKNWGAFRSDIKETTRLIFPNRIPNFEEFMNTGIVIKSETENSLGKLSLFDFETLVSPGIVLCPG